jgi:hypothetical protein
MAIDLGDSTFRPLLLEDIKTAWDVERVHYDPPQTPGSLSQLPRAFLQLQDFTDFESFGFINQVLPHTYTIAGQFAYPETGTLEEAKVEKAEALLAVLTAGNGKYHSDWRYRRFAPPRFEESRLGDDETERVYSVHLDFTLEWETGI